MKEIRKVETNTGALHLVSVGTYNTLLGEWLDRIPHEDREEAFARVCDIACDCINEHIWYADCEENIHCTLRGFWSPKYYNYETDMALLTLEYVPGYVWESLEGWEDDFADFLKQNYTSCDGFISFVPNNIPEWEQKFEENDDASVGAWMRWWLESRTAHINFDTVYEFLDRTHTLLTENYDYDWED